MPLNSTRGAGSAKGFGFTNGISWDGLADYLVVAGGGAGGGRTGGGGGAGGYRTSFPGGTKISIAKGTTPITVGGGGTGPSSDANLAPSRSGTDSILGTYITSTAGGGGGITNSPGDSPGAPGGSGGGAGDFPTSTGGAGNSPAVPATPLMPNGQGFNGGDNNYGPWGLSGTGGGGAGAAGGGLPPNTPQLAPGGSGLSNSISGTGV